MTDTQKTRIRAGFTLMELMIAITILGLLMAMVGPAIYNQLAKAKKRTAKSTMMSIKSAISEYKMDTGQFPQTLKDLIKKPAGDRVKKWEGPYLEKAGGERYEEIPEDPWGMSFTYKVTATGGKHPYELYSRGSDDESAPKEEWISVWDE